MLTATDLDVERLGSGPPVVLVHGSIVGVRRSWRKQLALGEQWALCLPNRPGFGNSPGLERGDFDAEAPLIAELLGESSHLVGHSYGAVIALLAAARRPEAIRSLIVSEPGLLRLAAGDPVADAMISEGEDMYRRGPETAPRDFLLAFRSGVHSSHETPRSFPTGWSGAPDTLPGSGLPGTPRCHSMRWPRRRFPSSSFRAGTRRCLRRSAISSLSDWAGRSGRSFPAASTRFRPPARPTTAAYTSSCLEPSS